MIGARLGGVPAARAAVRVTIGGGLAMALTALVGQLVGATGFRPGDAGLARAPTDT
jgi:VIT1/CCC1 family predicted Fe2+/Mn2+ transporter